jgi:hypothetical protein
MIYLLMIGKYFLSKETDFKFQDIRFSTNKLERAEYDCKGCAKKGLEYLKSIGFANVRIKEIESNA